MARGVLGNGNKGGGTPDATSNTILQRRIAATVAAGTFSAPQGAESEPALPVDGDTIELDPKAIAPCPLNPRKHLGDLSSLIASIKSKGVLEPGAVMHREVFVEHYPECDPDTEQREWVAIFGHRRRASAEAAGVLIKMILRDDIARTLAVEEAMVEENEERSNLSPIEQAEAIQDYRQRKGITAEAAGERLFKYTKGTTSKRLSLLRMAREVQDATHRGEVGPRDAYAIAQLCSAAAFADEEARTQAQAKQVAVLELMREGTLTADGAIEELFPKKIPQTDKQVESAPATAASGLAGQPSVEHVPSAAPLTAVEEVEAEAGEGDSGAAGSSGEPASNEALESASEPSAQYVPSAAPLAAVEEVEAEEGKGDLDAAERPAEGATDDTPESATEEASPSRATMPSHETSATRVASPAESAEGQGTEPRGEANVPSPRSAVGQEDAVEQRELSCQMVLESEDATSLVLEWHGSLVSVALEHDSNSLALAQLKAYQWLRSVGIGPEASNAETYFASISAAEDAKLSARAALGVALASRELRLTLPGHVWTAADAAHVEFLSLRGHYVPSAWEQSKIDEVSQGNLTSGTTHAAPLS
ncbi:ParB N-terminal domain-containing protein [Streptacidiphilus sp. EB103A]|uniref:ParB/RepB/Spo0J family partition protein n=1 Tax=Streptacidiphilus sp. EB103A TaxID=3156275 RepID=UPI00351124FB